MKISPNASPEERRRLNEFWKNLQNRRNEKYYKKQAAQRQAILNQLNSFMQNEYMPTITKDTQLQQMRARQQELSSTIKQNRTSFLNSLGFTEDKLRDPNLNPAIRNFISAGLDAWVKSQPEYQQIQQTNNNAQRYIQQTYPELVLKKRLFNKQLGSPTGIVPGGYTVQEQQQYQNQLFNQQQQLRGPQGQTPTIVRNKYDYLPEGLTQEQFMKQVRMNMDQRMRSPEEYREYFKPLYDSYLKEKATTTQAQPINPTQQQAFKNAQSEAIKKANEEFKERVTPTPIQPVQQDPIVDPKRPTTTGPRKITPIERPPVEPIVDPKRPTTTVPTTITPIKPPQQDPIVDPIREPYKPPKPITPIKRPPIGPIVDPIREPYTPPKSITPVKPVQKDPIVDPIRPMAPAKTGLMKQKSINPYVPMGYKSLNTDITKGLMNR